MTTTPTTDFHVGELLSGYIDGELTQQDRQRVQLHCEQCRSCSAQLDELRTLRTEIGRSTLSNVSQDVWRETTTDTATNASRGIGWLLLIGGALVAASLALYEFITEIGSMSTSTILILGGIYGGLLLLFVSVLRQRLLERKTDKYEDVEI
jgi:hypothetical protein